MPHSKAAKASVEAATADPAAVPAAHPRGESRLPFSVKPTAKPTINPEDKTAASTAKCVGTVKVVAPPLSPRARLTARRSPPPRPSLPSARRRARCRCPTPAPRHPLTASRRLSSHMAARRARWARRASPPRPARRRATHALAAASGTRAHTGEFAHASARCPARRPPRGAGGATPRGTTRRRRSRPSR